MKLIITRHGETVANEKGIACGANNNSGLNEVGKLQAKKLAMRLLKDKIDVVFCSDLKRCKQTLAPYLKQKKIPVYYTKLLREQNYGILDKKPMDVFMKWFKNNPGKDLEGWESKEQLKERISNFITQELSQCKGNNMLIVTHGRTKKMLLSILFAKSPKYQNKINEPAPNAGLSIIDLSDTENPILELLNCGKHLND